MYLQNWSDALAGSFQELITGIVTYVPNLVFAIILFIIGWVFGDFIGLWVARLVRALKVDRILEKLGLHRLVEQAGYRLDAGKFLGFLIKWFIILGFLVASLNVLKLDEVSNFLGEILAYIPSVIIATIILIIAAVVADVLQKVVVASARAARVSSAELFGGITKWLIWIFAIVMALEQLGMMGPFLQIFMTGIVATVSIALGLSFGLGGKEAASNFINKLRGEISKRD
ncbi:MAG TPA: hypothetical protein PLH96_00515 [Candidatus Paceibacterota bacterium]|nr:hypothetical protein [Candidatus Paceibacterota bacterium]